MAPRAPVQAYHPAPQVRPAPRPYAIKPPDNPRPVAAYRPRGWSPARPAYTHPARVWGDKRVYTYHRYYYHPYVPRYYGGAWHPLGFFLANLAFDASIIAWDGMDYRYYDGCFYAPYNGGYEVVAPPVGAIVPALPDGAETVDVGDAEYYYFGGVFYAPVDNGYQVIQAPPGAIVYDLPAGATPVQIDDNTTYLQYNGAYYQPITFNGQDAYEVAEVE